MKSHNDRLGSKLLSDLQKLTAALSLSLSLVIGLSVLPASGAETPGNTPPFRQTHRKTQTSKDKNGQEHRYSRLAKVLKDHELHFGWKEEDSGLIWFEDTRVGVDGKTADSFCGDLGLEVPTIGAFYDLAVRMGANGTKNFYDRNVANTVVVLDPHGYTPQALPNLNHAFWTRSGISNPYGDGDAFLRVGFDGKTGALLIDVERVYDVITNTRADTAVCIGQAEILDPNH